MTTKATKENPQAVSSKAILGDISTIQKSGKALEKLAHETAMKILTHVDTYGEPSLANKLIDALPTMARKNALRDWFQAFGKLKWNQEKRALVFKRDFTTNLEEAMETPFWEFKPEAEYKPYDLEKDIERLIKRAHTKLEEGNEKDKVDPALLAKLESLKAA